MHFIEPVESMKIRRIRHPLGFVGIDLYNAGNILGTDLLYCFFEGIITDVFDQEICDNEF